MFLEMNSFSGSYFQLNVFRFFASFLEVFLPLAIGILHYISIEPEVALVIIKKFYLLLLSILVS